jgi:hypothetical protein
MKKGLLFILSIIVCFQVFATRMLIPMDEVQSNHLKAYGITYFALTHGLTADWLLNYRGGSFAMELNEKIQKECAIRGVKYEVIAEAQYSNIIQQISQPTINQAVMPLEKAPKVAVYSPKNKQPWDDAVTLAMTYAEIPYEVVYDEDIIGGRLKDFDWLHLHHEDFTGQYGKFWYSYRNQPWFQEYRRFNESLASTLGFGKVSLLKLGVALRIKEYVGNGGFMFAMCAATDSYDIALAAHLTDICKDMFDGDAMHPNAQDQLDFDNTFAFKNFSIVTDPAEYEFSSIDATNDHVQLVRNQGVENDVFSLFEFSAKWDPVPTMLCQNHTRIVPGFMGQTTAFRKDYIKSSVLVMGETKSIGTAKYIHGKYLNGTWTFYGGHDPEDHTHRVNDPPTDLNLHPNSPGYRLILNNVLFPAAKKKKRKT